MNDKTEGALPACPFCGAVAGVSKDPMPIDHSDAVFTIWARHDDQCRIGLLDNPCFETEAEAVAFWSRRAPNAGLSGGPDKL